MDEFISALNSVKDSDADFGVKRDENIREPFENRYTGEKFRDSMLKNAPKVQDDCIVAEKKKW